MKLPRVSRKFQDVLARCPENTDRDLRDFIIGIAIHTTFSTVSRNIPGRILRRFNGVSRSQFVSGGGEYYQSVMR